MRVEMGVGRGQAWYLLLPVQTCNIRCSFVGNAGEGGLHKNGSLAAHWLPAQLHAGCDAPHAIVRHTQGGGR